MKAEEEPKTGQNGEKSEGGAGVGVANRVKGVKEEWSD